MSLDLTSMLPFLAALQRKPGTPQDNNPGLPPGQQASGQPGGSQQQKAPAPQAQPTPSPQPAQAPDQSQGNYWEYSQSTGQLTHVHSDGTRELVNDDAGEAGYSGHGDGLNNADAQDQHNEGPIPQGDWIIGAQQDNVTAGRHKLPASMRLTPAEGTETYGRDGFLIHGDNSAGDQSASNGCIVLHKSYRDQIGQSGDTRLKVVQ